MANVQSYAVDYAVFGDPGMRRTECVIDNEFSFANNEDFAKIIAHHKGLRTDYVEIYQFTLLNEPRSSYNRRL